MKKLVLSLITLMAILLLAVSAIASPFLISAPYSKDGSEPTTFIVVLNGTTYTSEAVATGTNQVYLHLDMAGKVVTSNTLTVKAQNIWGSSAISVPLVFVAVPPATPSGLSFSVN